MEVLKEWKSGREDAACTSPTSQLRRSDLLIGATYQAFQPLPVSTCKMSRADNVAQIIKAGVKLGCRTRAGFCEGLELDGRARQRSQPLRMTILEVLPACCRSDMVD